MFLLFILPAQTAFAAKPFSISAGNSTMEYGSKQKIKVANAKKKKVLFHSSNPKILKVDKKGNIQAVYPGNARITAKAGKESSAIQIRVIHKVIDLKINLKDNMVIINQVSPVNGVVQYLPVEAPAPDIQYSIKDQSLLAKVDKEGRLRGLKEGKTTLSLSAGRYTRHFSINVKHGKVYWEKKWDDSSVMDISWSENNTMFAVNNRVYDARNGKLIKSYDEGVAHFYHKGLITISRNGFIGLYNSRLQPEKKFSYRAPLAYYDSRTNYNPQFVDDAKLIFNDYDRTLQMNLDTEKVANDFKADGLPIGYSAPIQLTADGSEAAIAKGQSLYFFKTDSGMQQNQFTFDENIITFAFSPNGKYLTVINGKGNWYDMDRSVDIVNLETSLVDYTLEEHNGQATDAAYSPDGRFLATGGEDGLIHIYDTADYRLVKTLVTPLNQQLIQQGNRFHKLKKLSFSPDSKRLLTIYDDTYWDEPNMVLWNLSELEETKK